MKIAIWLSVMLLAVAVATAALILSGVYNVAADEPHWAVTSRILESVRDRSIAARAADVVVRELDDEESIRAGAGNYDAMCVDCHLRPGVERSEISAGLYPAPPDLTERRQSDPARDFVAIKHGIKMSGMPAWGASMEDGYIWGMVAFLARLPDLPESDYQALVAASGGHSHGGGETEMRDHHEESSPGHADSPDDHSGSAHEHGTERAAKPAPHSHDDEAPHEH